VTNDGTYGKCKPFVELLEMHLVRLGINQAKQVLLVADGAEWIWKYIPPLLQRLGCPPESIHQLLDFYHVTEHLHRFAEAAFTQPTERQSWFKQAMSYPQTRTNC
jgi:FMN phosphatase YigB (HAD superfamily)